MQIEYERYMELFLMLSMAIKENNTRFPSLNLQKCALRNSKQKNPLWDQHTYRMNKAYFLCALSMDKAHYPLVLYIYFNIRT